MGGDCSICTVLCHPVVISIVGALFAFKVWHKYTTGKYTGDRRMNGKTVIITGANTGIGKETAKDLARRGARVILACRDQARGLAAREEIMKSTGSTNVVLHQLDLASLSSVRKFADTILRTEARLDVLVNNAGAGGLGSIPSEDGLHVGMQVNHFGPFLLTNLLLGLLKKSSPSRIVMVSSLAHKFAIFNVEDLNCTNVISDFVVYGNSKLANLLMANELTRKLQGTGVTVNSLHPGAVNTELFRRLPSILEYMVNSFSKLFLKTPVEGAQTSIYLSVAPEVEGVSGKYFEDCKEASCSSAAKNEILARRLWEKSEEMVRLKPSEKFY